LIREERGRGRVDLDKRASIPIAHSLPKGEGEGPIGRFDPDYIRGASSRRRGCLISGRRGSLGGEGVVRRFPIQHTRNGSVSLQEWNLAVKSPLLSERKSPLFNRGRKKNPREGGGKEKNVLSLI